MKEEVHRLHFCEANLDKLPSSSQLIHFWVHQSSLGASEEPRRKSGRSATVLARGKEAEEEVVKASHLLLYRRQL